MRLQSIWKMAAAGALAVTMMAPAVLKAQGDTVLKPADTQKLLPASVFYRGQTATTQVRNSGGVKFADGFYVLAAMVDNSGYASDLRSNVVDIPQRAVAAPTRRRGADAPARPCLFASN